MSFNQTACAWYLVNSINAFDLFSISVFSLWLIHSVNIFS